MAKQALGRTLGALLDNTAKEAEKAPVSTGVRTLMRGNQPATSSPVVKAAVPAPPLPPSPVPVIHKSTLPVWYLFAGDVLLAIVSLSIVFASPHPLSWQRAVFCSVTVLIGAVLAIAAVVLTDEF